MGDGSSGAQVELGLGPGAEVHLLVSRRPRPGRQARLAADLGILVGLNPLTRP